MTTDELLKWLVFFVPLGAAVLAYLDGTRLRRQTAGALDIMTTAMDRLDKDLKRTNEDLIAARGENARMLSIYAANTNALRAEFDTERTRWHKQIDTLNEENRRQVRELVEQGKQLVQVQADYHALNDLYQGLVQQQREQRAVALKQQEQCERAARFFRELGMTDAQAQAVLEGEVTYAELKDDLMASIRRRSGQTKPLPALPESPPISEPPIDTMPVE